MIIDFLIGFSASMVVGIFLWLLLPRGVVLTRETVGPDEWKVKNNSSLPIKIRSVARKGATDTGTIMDWKEFSIQDSTNNDTLRVRPEIETLVYDLELNHKKWKGFILPPGDSLNALVRNNRFLRIQYRRKGFFGIFERREIEIHGSV